MVVVAIAGYFLGGATAKDNSLFGASAAAWAQAVFAAVGSGFVALHRCRRYFGCLKS